MWRLDLLGSHAQNPTLPLNIHAPQGEQKRQATAPARALKDKSRKDLGRGQVEEFKIKSGETNQF